MARRKKKNELQDIYGSERDTSTISGFVDDARQNNPTTILPRPQVSNQQRSLNQLSNDARMDEMVASAKNTYQMSQLRNMTRRLPLGFQGIGGRSSLGDYTSSRIAIGAGKPIEDVVTSNIPRWSRLEQPMTGTDYWNTLKMLGFLGGSAALATEGVRTYNRNTLNAQLKEVAGMPDAPFQMSKPSTDVTTRSRVNPRRYIPEAVPLLDTGKKKRRPTWEFTNPEGKPITRGEAIELARNWKASQSEGPIKDNWKKATKIGGSVVKGVGKVIPGASKRAEAKAAKATAEDGLKSYDYEAIDSEGKKTKGQIRAVNSDAAISNIRQKGLFPTTIIEMTPEAAATAEAKAAVEAEAPIEKVKPVESKAPKVEPAGGEPIRVQGEPRFRSSGGQGELFDMGPEVAPKPIYDKSMNPKDAWIKNQIDAYVNESVEQAKRGGKTLTEAEIAERRAARTQQWHQVNPKTIDKAMGNELNKIAKKQGWTAAAAHHMANTLNPRTGQPFTQAELGKIGLELERKSVGEQIRMEPEPKKPSGTRPGFPRAAAAPGARRGMVNPSAFGLGQGQFLNPKANLQALTKGGVRPTMGRGFTLAMAPEMINQTIDTVQEHLIDPRDAALDEAIGSPGATSYDAASAVPGTIAGIGDFLVSLGDVARPAQGGGLEFNTGLGANWYNPTIGGAVKLANRFRTPMGWGVPTFGLPEQLEGATHPSIFSDMIPDIPGSARGGSWGGLADQWRGVPEDLGTIAGAIGAPAKESLNDFVDGLINFRPPTPGGGYAPPMAR